MAENNNPSESRESICYCAWCKEDILEEEDRVISNNQVLHLNCFKEKNGYVDECNFDEE